MTDLRARQAAHLTPTAVQLSLSKLGCEVLALVQHECGNIRSMKLNRSQATAATWLRGRRLMRSIGTGHKREWYVTKEGRDALLKIEQEQEFALAR